MRALIRRLSAPANESQLALALAMSVAVMSFLLWGLLWQGAIISKQRDLIRWLWALRGGHLG
jgi:hypothetical protein